VVVGGALVAVAALGAWWATLDRNAWRTGSPRYVTVHDGCLVVLSSVWDRPPDRPWAYDVCVLGLPRWTPRVMRLGTLYSTGGASWSSPLWGVFVPLWVVGAGAGVVATAGLRGRWAEGWCRGCGYSLEGIAGVCPECGRAV